MDLNQIIESTLIDEWRQRLGQLPGGEFYAGPDLKWSLTGAEYLNAVFGARLAPQDIPSCTGPTGASAFWPAQSRIFCLGDWS